MFETVLCVLIPSKNLKLLWCLFEEYFLALAYKLAGLFTETSIQSILIMVFASKFSLTHIGVFFSKYLLRRPLYQK